MLTITVPGVEYWDDEQEKFVSTPETVIDLEHSLVSVSKWEVIYRKPFLTSDARSDEEAIAYIKCMTLTPEVAPEVYTRLSEENYKQVADYMNDSQTATWFANLPKGRGRAPILTNELLYYYMYSAGIDHSWQDVHLSRLLTLLQVFGAENGPKKKMAPQEVAMTQAEINRQRREKYNTTG